MVRTPPISVVTGIAQPRMASGSPAFDATPISAGASTPSAAQPDVARDLSDVSSPSGTSRLSSRPTSRTKNVVNPSLIHAINGLLC